MKVDFLKILFYSFMFNNKNIILWLTYMPDMIPAMPQWYKELKCSSIATFFLKLPEVSCHTKVIR